MAKRTKKSPSSEKQPLNADAERRNVRAFAALTMLFCALISIGGAGLMASNRLPLSWRLIVGATNFVSGILGIVGLISAMRGNRRASRVVYLMVLGIPAGALFTLSTLATRWDCLFAHARRSRPAFPWRKDPVTFQVPTLRIWIALLFYSVVGLAGLGLLVGFSSGSIVHSVLNIEDIASYSFALLIASFYQSFHTWEVSECGLCSPTDIELRWEQISSVIHIRLPCFPILLLRSDELVPPIIVPLKIRDLPLFQRAVGKYTTTEHPLRVVLDSTGMAGLKT